MVLFTQLNVNEGDTTASTYPYLVFIWYEWNYEHRLKFLRHLFCDLVDKNFILGDPGAVSRVWRKGATKVSKHGSNALNWKLTFVAPPDPTDCPWVSEDVTIIALKRKLLFRKCAVDFIPANFFWVQCVRFLPVVTGISENVLATSEDFRLFAKTSERYRKCPKMFRRPLSYSNYDNFSAFWFH